MRGAGTHIEVRLEHMETKETFWVYLAKCSVDNKTALANKRARSVIKDAEVQKMLNKKRK